MNPWPIILAIILLAAGAAGGWKAANDHRDALELVEAKGKSDALTATAEAIAKIDVRNVTVRQTVQTQIKEIPIYSECRNAPEVMQTINQALSGGAK
jgi:uncharacterized protein (UPF0333 family)